MNEQTSSSVGVLELLRPLHWVKNVFVFAPLVFAGKATQASAWVAAWLAFVGFCFLSSAVYIFNDLADVAEDRRHPSKRRRPIAAGRISRPRAALVAIVCFLLGAFFCFAVNMPVLAVGISYVTLNLFYSYRAKRWMLIDVMCIAAGFVLRAYAGGLAVQVPVSIWLVVCTFTLCMFLGFGKRRCEMAELGQLEGGASNRAVLSGYNPVLLDQLLVLSAGIAIVCYILYTVDPVTIEKLGTSYLFFSVPMVIYCVFRVVMLVRAGRLSEPAEAFIRDVPFTAALLLWVVFVVVMATWGADIESLLP